MNRETWGRVAIAVCCILALGVAGAAMDQAIETDPGEAIDTNRLSPLVNNPTVAEARQSAQEQHQSMMEAEERMQEDRATESSQDSGEMSSAEETRESGTASGDGGAEDTDFLSELLAALRAIIALILSFLPYLVIASVVSILFMKRQLLMDRWFRSSDHRDRTGSRDGPIRDRISAPHNDVERLWARMVCELDLNEHRSTTPREYAAQAVRMGADPTAVDLLTTSFEQVRYGNGREHGEFEEQARRGFALLSGDFAGREQL